MKFEIKNPDYKLSPYTGMTRKHWIDVSCFLLEGIFSNVENIEEHIVVKRHDKTVGYPWENGPKWRLYAEKFEGLARSFLVAAPLLHNQPEVEICGYSMKDYYKNQILNSFDKEHKNYFLRVEDILKTAENGEKAFQHTVECASIVIGLTMCKEVIWDTYTQDEKDMIADYLFNFANSQTGHHNWRLFNMLILAFLDREGYEIDHNIMIDHSRAIVSYYAGDGWYRDGHLFDYYCPWAFHVYGPLWNSWYGYKKAPTLAKKIEKYSNEIIKTLPAMFDEESNVTMWGRSGIYRSAVTAPFAANFLLKENTAKGGYSRKITSGALLQFVTREDCFYEKIPSLGFYSPFKPLIQSYSCGASPFWLANAFICLYLPEDHPFWIEKEENVIWDNMENNDVKTMVLNAPAIVLDNHKNTGITEFRNAKVFMNKNDHNLNTYMRLSFNSKFLWEDFDFGGAEAMQYSLSIDNNKFIVPNILMYAGERDGVLYRKEYFDFESSFQNKNSIDLADFPIKNGIIRVDRTRIHDAPYTLTLGSYGMPKINDICIEKTENSITLIGENRQISFINYKGFDKIGVKHRRNVNPETIESLLAYGEISCDKHYKNNSNFIITAILTKADNKKFTKEDLDPIKEIEFVNEDSVLITLNNGKNIKIDFEGMEGNLSI